MTRPTIKTPKGSVPLLLAALLGGIPLEGRGQESAPADEEAAAPLEARCEDLHRFMTETMEMAAEISPDTIDDWRTHKVLPGCRVTAVGSVLRSVPGEENEAFYHNMLLQGWARSPDPHDRPNEAAIRLRKDGTDCFFTPYQGIRLATDAEFRVNKAYETPLGEERFSFLAQCMEALPADP